MTPIISAAHTAFTKEGSKFGAGQSLHGLIQGTSTSNAVNVVQNVAWGR